MPEELTESAPQVDAQTVQDSGSHSDDLASTGGVPASQNGNGASEIPDFLREDPTDPPEVAQKKKDLEAGFHREMGRLNKREKEMDSFKAKQAQMERESQAFQTLRDNPDALEAFQKLAQGRKNGQTGPPSLLPRIDAKALIGRLPKEVMEGFEAEHVPPLVNMVWSVIEQGLIPLVTPYIHAVEQSEARRLQSEEQEVTKQLAVPEDLHQDVRRFAAEHGLNLRQAALILMDGRAPTPTTQPKQAPPRLPGSAPRTQVAKVQPQGKVDREALARELLEMDQAEGSGRYNPFKR